MSPAPEAGTTTRVWDLPTRLVHWMLALLVAASWFTGTYGALDWHRRSGYAIFGLVVFRFYWGFAGSSTARFSRFLRGPRAVLRYSRSLLQRSGSAMVGHNPIGGWSAVLMLLLLSLQIGLGLFAVDVDGIESGPLSDLVSFEKGRNMAEWHGKIMDALLVVIAVHIAAVLYYGLYKRENLIGPMLTGAKRLPLAAASAVRFVTFRRALVGAVMAALVVTAVVGRWLF